MTVTRVRTVPLGGLDLGKRLGQGGQGTVHEVTNRRINQTGAAWSVVYKEYNAALLPQADVGALGSLVVLLDTLDGTQGRWLCEKAAWPAAVVEESGRARGFLMRAVPDSFRFHMPGLTAKSSGEERLATVEFLLNDDAYVAGIGLKVSDKDRVLLLADLADILTRLHTIGIAIGDLSPKNLLFTLDNQPECFLIDCDAVRLRGASVLPQAETPDWQIPDGEEKATRESDIYKFGLLAIRLFARDQSATDPDVLAALGPRLAALARASLDDNPLQRPTPVAWAEALEAATLTASTAPAVNATAPKNATPPPTSKPTSPTTAASNKTAKSDDDGFAIAAVLAGIGLVAAYNWMPWINVPDGHMPFHIADAYTLSLFMKAFWAAIVGAFCIGTDEYLGNACGSVLGLVSFGCFFAGYQRLENEFASCNVHPTAGYVVSILASVVIIIACAWKANVRYQVQKP
jgi:serine/threonine protein kinase